MESKKSKLETKVGTAGQNAAGLHCLLSWLLSLNPCFFSPVHLKGLLSAVVILSEATSLLSSEIKKPVEILSVFLWRAWLLACRIWELWGSGPPNIYFLQSAWTAPMVFIKSSFCLRWDMAAQCRLGISPSISELLEQACLPWCHSSFKTIGKILNFWTNLLSLKEVI